MQQLISVWQGLDLRKQLLVATAAIGTFLAVLALGAAATRTSPDSLLYAGLDAAAAGDVIAALEQRGIDHVARGDAIYVPLALRDGLRMSLAAEGLPAAGGAGYELLDSLSGFGTTAQMFDAAYWRAKEGELARTVLSSPQIRAVRVHLAVPRGLAFREAARPTASVAVSAAAGAVSPGLAKALRHLVASAVAGMTPSDVSVIDADTGAVLSEDEAGTGEGADQRAAELRDAAQRLLEARVGAGRARVELSLETVTDRETISERRFDPAQRVAISTETEQQANSSNESRPAPVTVASNLPAGDAAANGSAQSSESQSRERVNYEIGETRRELLRGPGAIRRLTVAVLVDGIRAPGPEGTPVWQPRPQEELDALRELVASAVGFDEQRGDQITLHSLPFDAVPDPGSLAEAGFLAGLPLDVMSLLKLGLLAAVALVLGLFVLRPILSARPPAALPPPDASGVSNALIGEIHEGDLLPDIPILPRGAADDDAGLPDFSAGFAMGGFSDEGDDPVARLRRLIAERREETTQILRGWMEEAGEEKA